MGTVKKYENSVHKSNGCIVNKKRYKTMKLEKRCKYSVGKKTDKVKNQFFIFYKVKTNGIHLCLAMSSIFK